MQEQFLHGELLGYGAVGIAVPLHTFRLSLKTHHLHIRLQNGFVAHYPYHLIGYAALRYLHVPGSRHGVVSGIAVRYRSCRDAHAGQKHRCQHAGIDVSQFSHFILFV